MERWDFDCQLCGINIGNAWYVDPIWYRCPQEWNKHQYLEKVYPRFYILPNGDINGKLPNAIPLRSLLKLVNDFLKEKQSGKYENIKKVSLTYQDISFELVPDEMMVIWHYTANDDEYYKKAGIEKHKIRGRGWGRLGYCFCTECAKLLSYECPVCRSKLVKVTADEHPGGQWGIRGVREPAPMVFW